jgi:hypothetical protein
VCDAVTETLCVPLPAGAFQVVDDTVNVEVAAAWATVTVCPATMAVAERGNALVVAAVVSVTVPVPLPEEGLTLSHVWLLVADHEASLNDGVTVTV